MLRLKAFKLSHLNALCIPRANLLLSVVQFLGLTCSLLTLPQIFATSPLDPPTQGNRVIAAGPTSQSHETQIKIIMAAFLGTGEKCTETEANNILDYYRRTLSQMHSAEGGKDFDIVQVVQRKSQGKGKALTPILEFALRGTPTGQSKQVTLTKQVPLPLAMRAQIRAEHSAAIARITTELPRLKAELENALQEIKKLPPSTDTVQTQSQSTLESDLTSLIGKLASQEGKISLFEITPTLETALAILQSSSQFTYITQFRTDDPARPSQVEAIKALQSFGLTEKQAQAILERMKNSRANIVTAIAQSAPLLSGDMQNQSLHYIERGLRICIQRELDFVLALINREWSKIIKDPETQFEREARTISLFTKAEHKNLFATLIGRLFEQGTNPIELPPTEGSASRIALPMVPESERQRLDFGVTNLDKMSKEHRLLMPTGVTYLSSVTQLVQEFGFSVKEARAVLKLASDQHLELIKLEEERLAKEVIPRYVQRLRAKNPDLTETEIRNLIADQLDARHLKNRRPVYIHVKDEAGNTLLLTNHWLKQILEVPEIKAALARVVIDSNPITPRAELAGPPVPTAEQKKALAETTASSTTKAVPVAAPVPQAPTQPATQPATQPQSPTQPVAPAQAPGLSDQDRAKIAENGEKVKALLLRVVNNGFLGAGQSQEVAEMIAESEQEIVTPSGRATIIPLSDKQRRALERFRADERKTLVEAMGLNPGDTDVKIVLNLNAQGDLDSHTLQIIKKKDSKLLRVADFAGHTTLSMAKFAVAEFAIAMHECIATQDNAACKAFWEHLKSPMAHLGFAAFAATSHGIQKTFPAKTKFGAAAVSNLGMVAGMMMQNLLGQFGPGLEKYRKSLHVENPKLQESMRAEALKMLWEDTLASNKWQYDKIPEALGLIGSVIAANQGVKGLNYGAKIVSGAAFGRKGKLFFESVNAGRRIYKPMEVLFLKRGARAAFHSVASVGRATPAVFVVLTVEGIVEIAIMLKDPVGKFLSIPFEAQYHSHALEAATKGYESTIKLYQSSHKGMDSGTVEGTFQLSVGGKTVMSRAELDQFITKYPTLKKLKWEPAEWDETQYIPVYGSMGGGMAASHINVHKKSVAPILPIELFTENPTKDQLKEVNLQIDLTDSLVQETGAPEAQKDLESLTKTRATLMDTLARAGKDIVHAKAVDLRLAWDNFRGAAMKKADMVFGERVSFLSSLTSKIEAISTAYEWINGGADRDDIRWQNDTGDWKDLTNPMGFFQWSGISLGKMFNRDVSDSYDQYRKETKTKIITAMFCGPEIKITRKNANRKNPEILARQDGKTLLIHNFGEWIQKKITLEKAASLGQPVTIPAPPSSESTLDLVTQRGTEDLSIPTKTSDKNIKAKDVQTYLYQLKEKGLRTTLKENEFSILTDAIDDLDDASDYNLWRVASVPGLCESDYDYMVIDKENINDYERVKYIPSYEKFFAQLKKYSVASLLKSDFKNADELKVYTDSNCSKNQNFCSAEPNLILTYLEQLKWRHIGLNPDIPADKKQTYEGGTDYAYMIGQAKMLIEEMISPTMDELNRKMNIKIRETTLGAIYGASSVWENLPLVGFTVKDEVVQAGTKYKSEMIGQGESFGSEVPVYKPTGNQIFNIELGPKTYGWAWTKSYVWDHAGLPTGFYPAYDTEGAYWRNQLRTYDDGEHSELTAISEEMIQTLYQKKRMTDQFVVYLTRRPDYRVMKESMLAKVQEVWSRFVMDDVPLDVVDHLAGDTGPRGQYDQCASKNCVQAFNFNTPEGATVDPAQGALMDKIKTMFQENDPNKIKEFQETLQKLTELEAAAEAAEAKNAKN